MAEDLIGAGTWQLENTKRIEGDGGGAAPQVVVETWNGSEDAYATFIASYDIGDAHGTYTGLDLQSVEATFSKAAGKATLTYVLPSTANSTTTNTPPVGTTEKRSTTSISAHPLRSHPDWNGTWETPGEADYKDGAEVYFIVTTNYTYVTYEASFTWSQAAITANINTRFTAAQMTAKGLASATASRWLLIGLSAEQVGNEVTRVQHDFQYNSEQWDDDIHGAAV